MTARAFITGVSGTALTAEERAFLREAQPWGLIVFKRNVEAPDQLRALVAGFRDAVGRADAPVLVDAALLPLGIDVDCLPLADVPASDADPVIGNRAYGTTPDKVAALAGAI